MAASLFIDTAQRAARATAASSASSPSSGWVSGRVTEVLESGWVEVAVPADDPQTVATAPSDGTLTQVGAVVRVLLDGSGRATQISAPTSLDTSEDAAPVVATGAAGARMTQALTDARSALDGLDAQATAAAAAQSAADQARADAVAALKAAEESSVFSATAPESPRVGQVWYELNAAGAIVGIHVWDGSAWLVRTLAAGQVLVPGSVGSTLIGPGSVTTREIDVDDLWAEIVRSRGVTTDMLTAGNATIPGTAVVGDLVGNTLRGGVLSLLDQAQTPSTATGSNTASAWRYQPDGVMPGTTTGSVSTVSGYPVVTITSGTTPGGFFPASLQYGAVFGPAAAVGAITYSVTVKVAGGSGPISFSVQSNEATTYSGGYVNAVSGGTYTLKATIPEGQWINQQSGSLFNRIVIKLGAGFSQGTTFTITSITASWPPALNTGLKIYRDSTGQARIDVVGNDGNTTILNSSGVTMKDASGATIGSIAWRNLVAPPYGALTRTSNWTHTTPGGWQRVNLTNGQKAELHNGFTQGDSYLTVPVTGLYRVQGRVGLQTSSGRIGVAVAAGATSPSAAPQTVLGAGAGSAAEATVEVNADSRFKAGDLVGLWAFQENGGGAASSKASLTINFIRS